MDLTLLIDYVLPSSSVLMKHCNGGWDFYKSDDDFVKDESYMSQDSGEDFHHFMERLIQKLMKDEENDEERLVAIDYAIWSNHDTRWVKENTKAP